MTPPRVAYLVTYPRDVDPSREAVAQDIAALRARLPGPLISISPPERLRPIVPERVFGLWAWRRLRALNSRVDAIFVTHGQPVFFPVLRALTRPLVYNVVADAVGPLRLRHPAPPTLAGVIAASVTQRDRLIATGVRDVTVIPPGIELARFPQLPELAHAPGERFVLLHASAPWQVADFARKGIDSLLDAAVVRPDLQLIFLWRGRLLPEMRARIEARNLHDRVTVVDRRVAIGDYLAVAHAAVLWVTDPSVVKAYPHSLLEALASGRPVLLSPNLALAADVAAQGVGVAAPLVAGLDELMMHYHRYASSARQAPREQWDRARWLDQTAALIARAASSAHP